MQSAATYGSLNGIDDDDDDDHDHYHDHDYGDDDHDDDRDYHDYHDDDYHGDDYDGDDDDDDADDDDDDDDNDTYISATPFRCHSQAIRMRMLSRRLIVFVNDRGTAEADGAVTVIACYCRWKKVLLYAPPVSLLVNTVADVAAADDDEATVVGPGEVVTAVVG